ncbi:unnamed protein product [Prunus armeniaca]|uniref:Uncharacterized protein n=1 Tax=Prunus armeniaca TaxID=36596 RepID=A0A6J5WG26_PRUAR|nr:unnamed protein product [Prunus armeniaca]
MEGFGRGVLKFWDGRSDGCGFEFGNHVDLMKGTRTEGNQGFRSISVAMVRCVFYELAARYEHLCYFY